MTDTNAILASLAEKAIADNKTAMRPVSLAEARARKIYFDGLAAFRSNCLDAADLCPEMRADLLALIKTLDANAPTKVHWKMAIDGKAGQQ